MEIKKNTQSKKRYSQISLKKREQLVNSVIQLGQSLTKVAKKLKIKLSTAKLILKKFKKTGVLFNKRLRNARKQSKTQIINPIIEQVRLFEAEEASLIEEKGKMISTSNPQTIQNVYQVTQINLQPIYWLPYLQHQQIAIPWSGYYYVL